MAKLRLPMAEDADALSLKALRELVTGLVERADIWIGKLEAENQKLRDEHDQLRTENIRMKVDKRRCHVNLSSDARETLCLRDCLQATPRAAAFHSAIARMR
ncbi:hypothetical protein [Allorhizobium borbori]|uniref:Transposase n=1 Tax=Allorhizobium borbori TaxID=485907 RepID=A0A7W6K2I0_9HYPH|nr:hypothetical protein [Allorhizobium borbori]MBB4103066.1 hypothetical protein [Allorhizobium borbori]